MRIYAASSWRNLSYKHMVVTLRKFGHEVYDFTDPATAFGWQQVDPEWRTWSPEDYLAALHHPLAKQGFAKDFQAMEKADACVLVLPSGRSSHLEAGWCIGQGKPTAIYMEYWKDAEAELMYSMADALITTEAGLIQWCSAADAQLVTAVKP